MKEESDAWVSHGKTTHSASFQDRMNCLFCIEVELEFLLAVKKEGGLDKFLESLRKK